MEGVEHEEGLGETVRGGFGELGGIERGDEGLDVVAALHGTEDLDRLEGGDERGLGLALDDGGEPASLDVGRLVHARRDAVLEEVEEHGLFAGGGTLELGDELGDLLRVEGLGSDSFRCALLDVRVVLVEEGGCGAGGETRGTRGSRVDGISARPSP